MPQSNGHLHHDILGPSATDDVALGEAVEIRFVQILNDWLRTRGEELVPSSIHGEIVRWREMRQRHGKLDFRHRPSELAATKVVAEWTLKMKAILTGQAPAEVEWEH